MDLVKGCSVGKSARHFYGFRTGAFCATVSLDDLGYRLNSLSKYLSDCSVTGTGHTVVRKTAHTEHSLMKKTFSEITTLEHCWLALLWALYNNQLIIKLVI